MLCMIIFWVALIFLFSFTPTQVDSSDSHINYLAHLGGFIAGLFLGLLIPKPMQSGEWEKNCRIIGAVLLGIFVLLIFVLFYTTKDFK